MQPFQTAVLLRLAGRNALGHDASLDHLDREKRQAAGATRGKRRSIVGAQSKRQAELPERCFQHRPDVIRISSRHRLAAQQIAAVGVAQRQRLATRPVAGHEPAFEVDAPPVIGRRALPKRRARWRAAPAQTALDRQAFAIEQLADRARGRPPHPRSVLRKPAANLHRPPGRMRPAHGNALFGDPRRHCLRMMQRRARMVLQPLHTLITIALKPFVARLATHAEAPTQAGKRFLVFRSRHHKAHPLFHGTGLSPNHRQGPPCRSVEPVTHVPGLFCYPCPRSILLPM